MSCGVDILLCDGNGLQVDFESGEGGEGNDFLTSLLDIDATCNIGIGIDVGIDMGVEAGGTSIEISQLERFSMEVMQTDARRKRHGVSEEASDCLIRSVLAFSSITESKFLSIRSINKENC